METMAGEGEGDSQTQGSNQLENFVQGTAETLDGKGGTAPKELGQISAVNMSPKAKVCQHDQVKMQSRVCRVLMEVFSVKLPEFEMHNIHEQMYGCILILSDCLYVVLDRIKKGTPLNIDDEGFIRVRGPNRVINASNYVRFTSHLFRRQAWGDQFLGNGDDDEKDDNELTMWNIYTRIDYGKLLTASVKSQFGPVIVNYAVYKDGAEAWLDVRVVGCQFPAPVVYGTITARNSHLNEKATSVLFIRKREEGINLNVVSDSDKGKYTHLPLSRSKIVHPYGSDVTISLEIMQRGSTKAQDQPIASNVELCFTTCFSGREVKTAGNGVCLIEVTVTWQEKCEPISKGPRVV